MTDLNQFTGHRQKSAVPRSRNAKHFVKLSDIQSSKLSRLINGESQLGSEFELHGEREFITAIINGEELENKKGQDYDIDSQFFESNGFNNAAEIIENPEQMFYGITQGTTKEARKKVLTNGHLSKLQQEIYSAIKYDDHNKLLDMGAKSEVDLNFMIEVEPK